MSDHPTLRKTGVSAHDHHMLWIDAVGAFQLCLGSRVTVGGPATGKSSADIHLLASLARRHATFIRSGERYVLEARGPVRVAGRRVDERVDLHDGCEIELGEGVRWRFRIPSALSATARLEFLSDHRPPRSLDGVILMEETCLLGPGGENHVRCPEWSESVLLYRREGALWCRSRAELFVDGERVGEGRRLAAGSVVTGLDLQFRIEPASENA